MAARWTRLVIVAASLVAGTLHAGAEEVPVVPELPRATCAKRLVDALEDAAPDYTGRAMTSGQFPTKAALDITGVTIRTTADHVQVFLGIKALGDPANEMEAHEAGYKYTVTFRYSGKLFTLFQRVTNAKAPLLGTSLEAPDSAPPGTAIHFVADPAPKPNAVVFNIPRAAAEELVAGPIVAGEKFTEVIATTEVQVPTRFVAADELDVTGDAAVFTAGDDYCFGPPPAALSGLVLPAVQYGDKAQFSAKLVDELGEPLAGKTVTFSVAGDPAPATGVTGTGGVVTATYTALAPAGGSRAVTVRYAGEPDIGAATATGSVLVNLEKTKFAALTVAKSGTTGRIVTAILRDDDNTAVARQKVDWYVNGKKVTSIATDASGKSVFRSAKAGQTIVAKFATVAGKYSGSASASKKV